MGAVELPDVPGGDDEHLSGLGGEVFGDAREDPAFNVALVTLSAGGDYV